MTPRVVLIVAEQVFDGMQAYACVLSSLSTACGIKADSAVIARWSWTRRAHFDTPTEIIDTPISSTGANQRHTLTARHRIAPDE